MTERERHERNARMLAQIHAPVRAQFKAVITDLEGHGIRPRIQCAWRSIRDQVAAVKSGASRVTWGYHCAMDAHGAPDALAADMLDDDAPTAPSARYLKRLRSAARAHGLDAPIDWDPCHVQVTGLSIAAARRGARPGDPDADAA